MDQVTLIAESDLESLQYHLYFTRKNLPFIRRTFYIIPSKNDLAARARSAVTACAGVREDQIVFVPEDEILPSSVCKNKWIYQQLIKLSVYKLRPRYGLSEPFLFTDIDTLCLRPLSATDLKHNGKGLFWLAHYEKKEDRFDSSFEDVARLKDLPHIDRDTVSWLMGFSWTALFLLGIKEMPAVSAVNACVIWYSTILEGLVAVIEKRFGRPFHESILEAFKQFIAEHKKYFYEYAGYRKIVMSYYGGEGLTKCDHDEQYYFEHLRLGFSEWQLYTLFLSVLRQQPYALHFQMPGRNAFIAEFNSDVQNIEILKAAVNNADRGGKECHFINFYPKIDDRAIAFLTERMKKYENAVIQ
jgi:hypothetical protein